MWVEFTRAMGRFQKGAVRNLPETLARRAIKIKRARPTDPPTETAMVGPPENAARRTGRPTTCGAETASGKRCTRATDGGPCWQHAREMQEA